MSLGSIRTYTHTDTRVELDCGGPRLALTVLTPRMVRVRLAPTGAFAPRRSWAVAAPDSAFPSTPLEVQATPHTLLLQTELLTITIERDPCRIAFANTAGQRFCADAEGMRWGYIPHLEPDVLPLGTDCVACSKRIEANEHFYGFGERTGQLDKFGRRMLNWTTDPPVGHGPGTDPLYMAIPVFMVLRPGLAYGVFFNNTWPSRFDIGHERVDTWSMEAGGGELDYYVCYGPTPAEVVTQIGILLGTMPLPPRWALGYHQSRWSYATDSDVRQLAAMFRTRAIPCDGIHFDIDYMHGYRVFTWDTERFPNPTGLLADLRHQHFHAVAIIDPGVKIDPDYPIYQTGIAGDMFVRKANGQIFQGYVWPGDTVFPDFLRPEVCQWWADWQKTLVAQGISGIWNDMNEPTSFARPLSAGPGAASTIDADALQGSDAERVTHAEVHNLYGSHMARAAYEGLRRDLDGQRPFVLTRSAFAGIQRWSAGWMGDNSSWWEHLEMAMPQLLNMGLSGVPFVGVDIGGFFGNASGELFARWMQLGALLPFCRGHTAAHTERHEPWAFGPQVEAICRDYLQLRYRLLPYLYTLFWEAACYGTPILRPLLYHFADDPVTYHLHDQVLLGPSLLAAPIYHPGREYRVVYLPAGDWYDWWQGDRLTGPAYVLEHAPLEKLPLFVRAGAIIPTGPDMNYTDQYPLDPLTLDLYPGDGTFTLYEDDGCTFAHEQGQFCTTAYQLQQVGDELIFQIGSRTGAYVPPARQLRLRVHNVAAEMATDHPGATYANETSVLTLHLADDGNTHTLRFRLKGMPSG